MSMLSEHAMSIAENIAQNDYKIGFEALPKSVQRSVFNRACELAQQQINRLSRLPELEAETNWDK